MLPKLCCMHTQSGSYKDQSASNFNAEVLDRTSDCHTCIAVRQTKGNAPAWSKETSLGIVASKLLLMLASSA